MTSAPRAELISVHGTSFVMSLRGGTSTDSSRLTWLPGVRTDPVAVVATEPAL